MQMQPGCATILAQGQRGSTSPTAAKIIAADDAGREPAPETVDFPLCRMTRHAEATARCQLIAKPGAHSESSPRCRSLAEPLIPAICGRFPFLRCPPRLALELVSSVARRYKMLLSGGFLFRADGATGVQDVPLAGVFVPQVWNQHADQSASRICPVGAWLRLYHGVPGSCQLSFRSSNSCTRLGHRRRAPDSRAPKDGACKVPRSAHYFQTCRQRDSMTASTTLSPSKRGSPTAAGNASGSLEPHTSLCHTWCRCGRRGPGQGFTYELPYEGLSGASWITQTGLQRWHSDR